MEADVIIVGQGLAGSALAWALHWRDVRVMLVDAHQSVTASRIAAGLLTPITGKKLVKTKDFEQFFSIAEQFYRGVERETCSSLFFPQPMVRWFQDEAERQLFFERQANHDSSLIRPLFSSDGTATGFQMEPAGRLKTAAYLDATQRFFQARDQWHQSSVDVQQDVQFSAEDVRIPRLQLSAQAVVLCQGAQGRFGTCFPQIPDSPARGDILRISLPGLRETRIQHRGIWLVPEGQDEYLLGATYDMDDLSNRPSDEGRKELLRKLEQLTADRAELVSHQAAVRAGMKNFRPVVRWHHQQPRLALLNGLGSRGALWAPACAERMADQLIDRYGPRFMKAATSGDGGPSAAAGTVRLTETAEGAVQKDPEGERAQLFDILRPLLAASADQAARRRSLTQLVHQLLVRVVQPGDRVIDATVGNGHDTVLLAQRSGSAGRVTGYDIQPAALESAKRRLESLGIQGVDLRLASHRHIAEGIEPGTIAAITFNLGYLPGGDKTIKTSAEETVPAILQSLPLLQHHGLLTMIAYRGHPGGQEEAEAIQRAVEQLPLQQYYVQQLAADSDNPCSPLLTVICRCCRNDSGTEPREYEHDTATGLFPLGRSGAVPADGSQGRGNAEV